MLNKFVFTTLVLFASNLNAEDIKSVEDLDSFSCSHDGAVVALMAPKRNPKDAKVPINIGGRWILGTYNEKGNVRMWSWADYPYGEAVMSAKIPQSLKMEFPSATYELLNLDGTTSQVTMLCKFHEGARGPVIRNA